jgi:hypothetical protein
MRSRGFLSILVILSTLAVPAAAQTPTPATTAFDGKYVGTATATGGGHAGENCFPILYADMTISGGPSERSIAGTFRPGLAVVPTASLNSSGKGNDRPRAADQTSEDAG